ncbi:restriction endonuclease subunit S, partial [Helicobacter salomonis]|uniref:restriction endonuclease subunit S n=1 Tax=Helicobacter salomonis TaxID=56878 RepID=UPI0018F8647E
GVGGGGGGVSRDPYDFTHALLKKSFKVEWVELGTIGEFIWGHRIVKADLQPKNHDGTLIGAIHYGQIHTHYSTYTDNVISFISPQIAKKLRKAKKGDLLFVNMSENINDICKAVAYLGDDDICFGDMFAFRHNQNPKYLAYFFQTQTFLNFKKRFAYGAKIIYIDAKDLKTFLIPLPPLVVQAKIVEILDQFHALTTDLQEGLPAEIEARKKQYNHYLNALLHFEEHA